MKHASGLGILTVAWFLTGSSLALGAGKYFEVRYEPSQQPGELQMDATYTLWVPDGAEKLRAIIVHQHGCGAPACKGGATAAYDLHWQALAKKWNCALLGPSYGQLDKQNCALWSNPANGSGKTFLKALADLAAKAGRPELDRVPWCLWGHSGGGSWAGYMLMAHPERTVAVWFRSGAGMTRRDASGAQSQMPEAVCSVPMMCNPGVKEKGDAQFNRIWSGNLELFQTLRAKGAPIAVAPDPRTSHECGDSRYLAIPFFDACLAMRLPEAGSAEQNLKPVDGKQAWLAPLFGTRAEPAGSYAGKPEEAVWLPNQRVAKAWEEYVKTGAVGDASPPKAPYQVRVTRKPDQTVEIAWDAEADFESGIKAFVIQRDGKELVQVPEKPAGIFGRPLFQKMSYHDTPEPPLPEMRYVDASAKPGEKHTYRVITVNSVGLASPPSAPVSIP